jgi:hypothetical protein
VASIKAHPEEESKNEKRQKSADYCVKKSLFPNIVFPRLAPELNFKTV